MSCVFSASGDSSYATESSNPTDTDVEKKDGSSSVLSNSNNKSDPYQSEEFLNALEDVHTRFILNLPPEELETAEKIFFQVEQAWWFYEDWICDAEAGAATAASVDYENLPRFSHLKSFALKMFEYSPILPSISEFASLWEEFSHYKRKISNYGCILLNQSCTKIVLCQAWNGKSWSLPAGKINQGESGVEAATRETYEETGFDPHCQQGIARQLLAEYMAKGETVPWNYPLREQDALSYQEPGGGKRRTCFVCCGVPEDFVFGPISRKEVSKVDWFTIDGGIPKPNYAVLPFLSQLKRWITKHKKRGSNKKIRKKKTSSSTKRGNKSRERATTNTNNFKNNAGGGGGGYHTPRHRRNGANTPRSSRPSSRQGSRSRSTVLNEQDALVEAGLANAGELNGWSEEDMFHANEVLLGRKIEYDGNPHQFAEEGFFGGHDPHAFHVVGGTFLNSEAGISSLAPPPQQSRLQPLFRPRRRRRRRNNSDGGDGDDEDGDDDDDNDDGDDDLQPFFSTEGATPWGELVTEASGGTQARGTISAMGLPSSSENNNSKSLKNYSKATKNKPPNAKTRSVDDDDGEPEVIFTDAEITRRSQAAKAKQLARGHTATLAAVSTTPNRRLNDDDDVDHDNPVKVLERLRHIQQKQFEADMAFIQNWVANLPKPKPTRHFGEFKLDAQAIMEKVMQFQ